MNGKALFIPLKKCYFDAFASGRKTVEYRKAGKRWNLKTCTPGREVILSCGYGKQKRLAGRIQEVFIETDPDEFDPDFISIYGKNANQLSIHINVIKEEKGE